MILNTLKIIGVAIGVMAVVLAIGCLYVMNEMRNELKKDKGVLGWKTYLASSSE